MCPLCRDKITHYSSEGPWHRFIDWMIVGVILVQKGVTQVGAEEHLLYSEGSTG